MAKKTKPSFNAAAAYAADPDDASMGQDQSQAPAGPGAGAPGGDQQGSGQDITIPGQVVAQLEQLKQSGDMQSLGQIIAQLLP